jgi:hypothetical protein
MESEKDVKTRRKIEEFLRKSEDQIIISFGIVMGFVKNYNEKVDVKKVRRKIEDVIRKDEKLMKSLAMVIKKLETAAD